MNWVVFQLQLFFSRENDESFLLSCPGPLFPCCVLFPGCIFRKTMFLASLWLAAPSQIFWLAKASFPKLETSAAKFSLSRHLETWLLSQAYAKHLKKGSRAWFSLKIQQQRLVLEVPSGGRAHGQQELQTQEPPPLIQTGDHRWGDHRLKRLPRAALRVSWKYSGNTLSLWVLGSCNISWKWEFCSVAQGLGSCCLPEWIKGSWLPISRI